jgi:hypothetical protein
MTTCLRPDAQFPPAKSILGHPSLEKPQLIVSRSSPNFGVKFVIKSPVTRKWSVNSSKRRNSRIVLLIPGGSGERALSIRFENGCQNMEDSLCPTAFTFSSGPAVIFSASPHYLQSPRAAPMVFLNLEVLCHDFLLIPTPGEPLTYPADPIRSPITDNLYSAHTCAAE